MGVGAGMLASRSLTPNTSEEPYLGVGAGMLQPIAEAIAVRICPVHTNCSVVSPMFDTRRKLNAASEWTWVLRLLSASSESRQNPADT